MNVLYGKNSGHKYIFQFITLSGIIIFKNMDFKPDRLWGNLICVWTINLK